MFYTRIRVALSAVTLVLLAACGTEKSVSSSGGNTGDTGTTVGSKQALASVSVATTLGPKDAVSQGPPPGWVPTETKVPYPSFNEKIFPPLVEGFSKEPEVMMSTTQYVAQNQRIILYAERAYVITAGRTGLGAENDQVGTGQFYVQVEGLTGVPVYDRFFVDAVTCKGAVSLVDIRAGDLVAIPFTCLSGGSLGSLNVPNRTATAQ